ncbi:MAG TPA: sulfatase-like hydrolase/transferase, partial [Puia sp.]|nr:sulfatase-like hydrolase/transferase [Puia sp.]
MIRWIFSTGIIFLVIMTLLRLGFFLFFSRQGNHFTGALDALWLGVRYDLRTISVLLTVILLAGSIPVLHPFNSTAGKKFWPGVIGVAAFLLVFFYVVDFAHYSYLTQRLNASVLNYLSDAAISADMVWQTYPVFRIVLLLIAGTWLIYWLVMRRYQQIARSNVVVSRKNAVISFCICFLLFGVAIMGRIGQYPLRWSDAFALGSDYKANLSLNPFQSFFSSMKFRHSSYDAVKVKKAYGVLAPYFGWDVKDSLRPDYERVVAASGTHPASRPNVVVVICESFSAYKSSMWGNPLNTTPFFNEMSRHGIFFDRCFTPSYGTARGVWALITGIPDVEVATTTSSRNPSAVDQHTIINDFEGYEKFYFLGGSTSWANIRGLLTNNINGLHLYEQQDYDAPKIDVWGISDKNLFLEANKV